MELPITKEQLEVLLKDKPELLLELTTDWNKLYNTYCILGIELRYIKAAFYQLYNQKYGSQFLFEHFIIYDD